MSFLDAAPRWFACFDQPDLKAVVSLELRCPEDWVVSGNGPATCVAPGHWGRAPLRGAGPWAPPPPGAARHLLHDRRRRAVPPPPRRARRHPARPARPPI